MKQKKLKIKLKKERNPFVQHLIGKKQGAHIKSKKAIRKKDRENLKKEWLHQLVI